MERVIAAMHNTDALNQDLRWFFVFLYRSNEARKRSGMTSQLRCRSIFVPPPLTFWV